MILLLLWSIDVSAQAKKPELLIIPSDKYCNDNGYVKTVQNMGQTRVVMDYRKLFLEDKKFPVALAQINKEFGERGFQLLKLDEVIKKIEADQIEMSLMQSKSGEEVSISPLDRIKQVAKADIILSLDMSLNESWEGSTCDITLFAIDAYTSKSISSITGQSPPNSSLNIQVLVKAAILAYIDDFQQQLIDHFTAMKTKGREISLKVKLYNSAPFVLDDEFTYPDLGINEEDEVIAIINEWLRQNCVNGVFNMNNATENFIDYSNVRIPLYEEKNGEQVAVSAYSWSKDLQKMFKKAPFETKAKRYVKGLGEIWIIIGE